VGEELTGRVSRVAPFGVFLEFADRLRGLLHADEVVVPGDDSGREPNIPALFNVGDEVKVCLPRAFPATGTTDQCTALNHWGCCEHACSTGGVLLDTAIVNQQKEQQHKRSGSP
jgi:hypothetical protein